MLKQDSDIVETNYKSKMKNQFLTFFLHFLHFSQDILVGNVKRATRVSPKLQAQVYFERPVRFLLFVKKFHIFCPDKIYLGYLGHEWTVFLTNISFGLFYSTN